MENSPLDKLPSEVRNIIYQYLLHEPDAIRVHIPDSGQKVVSVAKTRNGELAKHWHDLSRTREIVRLFTVCRLMRNETRPYYLNVNHIIIYAPISSLNICGPIRNWLLLFGHPGTMPKPRSVTFYSAHHLLPQFEVHEVASLLHPDVPFKLLFKIPSLYDDLQIPSESFTFEYELGQHKNAKRKVDRWLASRLQDLRSSDSLSWHSDNYEYAAKRLKQMIKEITCQQFY